MFSKILSSQISGFDVSLQSSDTGKAEQIVIFT